ncbi:peptidase C14 caspase catalytic subunit p20 [Streptomyces werraensis]|nr:peptidase C14 caspase catalytic subunit p20 [Streptomyces werraensis]
MVGTVAVPEYAHPDPAERQRLNRPQLAEVRDRFTRTVRERLGFRTTLRADRRGATRQELLAGLEEFLTDGAEQKILYWTGHGVQRRDEGYFLACADSWESGEFDPGKAVPLLELVGFLLRPEFEADTLLIVDACSSQSYNSLTEAVRHAVELQRDPAVDRAWESRRKGFAVIGTSGADAQVPAGRWVTWLEEALAKPEFTADDASRPFEPQALYLPLPYLCQAVDARAADDGLDEQAQRPDCREIRALPNSFLDNPYHQRSDRRIHMPAALTRRKPWIEAEQFGLEDDSHLHRHFAGRRDALSRIVRWMDTHPQGMLAVTGLAGTGKTALLGRLALTSLPGWRAALGPGLDPATLPRTGTVHAALSCQGQSAHSLAVQLREVLSAIDGAPPLPEEPVGSERFTDAFEQLVGQAGSVNLLFDGLDEALPDQAHAIARHVLGPLAKTLGVRVIVATRAQPRRRTTAPAGQESLLDALELSVEPLVLGDDAEARESIAGMVRSVLDTEGSPYRGEARQEDREWTAETVAQQSHGSFLVARLVATGLARRTTVAAETELTAWLRDGGTDLRTRLTEETAHLGGQPGARRAHEVLRALAVAQGPGLAQDAAWLTLADALREPGTPELTARDVREVCRSAGGGIVAAQRDGRHTSGRTRYQLAHPSFGAFFLSDAGLTTREAHRRVLDALRATAGGDWGEADEYTLEYLGAHAAQVGPEALRELFEDVDFLLRTDPDVMLPLAAGLARECDGAALYGRVAGAFPRTSGRVSESVLLERKALLRSTAFVSHRDGTYRTLRREAGFLPWEEYWTDVPPDPSEWRRVAPTGGARALSWRAGTGPAGAPRADTLTAGGLGEIQVLHPESDARLLTRRLRRSGGGRGRPLSEVHEVGSGTRWATVARDDQSVYFWHAGARTPRQEYRWGGSVRALSAAELGGECVALAADGDRLWVWFWHGGSQLDTRLTQVRSADVRQLAVLVLGMRMFVLAAGAERVELLEVVLSRHRGAALRTCAADVGVRPGRAGHGGRGPPGLRPGGLLRPGRRHRRAHPALRGRARRRTGPARRGDAPVEHARSGLRTARRRAAARRIRGSRRADLVRRADGPSGHRRARRPSGGRHGVRAARSGAARDRRRPVHPRRGRRDRAGVRLRKPEAAEQRAPGPLPHRRPGRAAPAVPGVARPGPGLPPATGGPGLAPRRGARARRADRDRRGRAPDGGRLDRGRGCGPVRAAVAPRRQSGGGHPPGHPPRRRRGLSRTLAEPRRSPGRRRAAAERRGRPAAGAPRDPGRPLVRRRRAARDPDRPGILRDRREGSARRFVLDGR